MSFSSVFVSSNIMNYERLDCDDLNDSENFKTCIVNARYSI